MRTQHDELQNYYSQQSALICPPEDDRTRQEWKQDADINHLMQRFGVGVPQKQQTYGLTVDYNLDLQAAYDAVAQAKHAYRNMPDNLRAKYTSWQTFLNAISSGQLKLELTEPPIVPPAEPAP